uniref:ATP synthase CF1 subunit delta n=1 Tax=Compsothamnion thuioides TaxID=3097386 RepID=A0A4D6WPM3_9FLOR|nr:ATP synthase CF1 subunit delta [Compsothamnion thuyoides]
MSNQSMMFKVATPYAEALLGIAKKENALSTVNEDLSMILNALSESIDLKNILSNPLIGVLAKKSILIELFQSKVHSFVLNFLLVLVDRRRIFLLSAIINRYLELSYKAESTVVVQLFTAIVLSDLQHNAIIEKIKEMTQSQNVKLMIEIDSSLIGGFVLKIGSKVIDTSLAGKLRQISFYLNKS